MCPKGKFVNKSLMKILSHDALYKLNNVSMAKIFRYINEYSLTSTGSTQLSNVRQGILNIREKCLPVISVLSLSELPVIMLSLLCMHTI